MFHQKNRADRQHNHHPRSMGNAHWGHPHHGHHPHDEHPHSGRHPIDGHRGGGRPHGGHNDEPRSEENHGGRMRRGTARYLLLDALRDGAKHGYEIIRALEERSGGAYVPSPGTVYPTLQFLEDAGFVSVEQQAERRVFQLTETGRADLDSHAEEIAAFWSGFAKPVFSPASQTESGFLFDEMGGLNRTIRDGVQPLMESGDLEAIRRIRHTVEVCKNEIRRMLAESNDKERK